LSELKEIEDGLVDSHSEFLASVFKRIHARGGLCAGRVAGAAQIMLPNCCGTDERCDVKRCEWSGFQGLSITFTGGLKIIQLVG
jgi:hypothetical protein